MATGSAEVVCRRCNLLRPALAGAPLPGKWGAMVAAHTCTECWHEWVEEQTRLINHERLLPSDREHRKVLYERMASFLNLADKAS
jgi:Fe-S cluster biosynthesis and repair protein YggX